MAKKYVPSGYQIIEIDLTNRTSGTGFTPETQDEKVLYDLLVSNDKIRKPILIHILNSGADITTFCILESNYLYVTYGEIGSLVSYSINGYNNKLTWVYNEE